MPVACPVEDHLLSFVTWRQRFFWKLEACSAIDTAKGRAAEPQLALARRLLRVMEGTGFSAPLSVLRRAADLGRDPEGPLSDVTHAIAFEDNHVRPR